MATSSNSHRAQARISVALGEAGRHSAEPALQHRQRVRGNARALAVALLNRVWSVDDASAEAGSFTLRARPGGQPVGAHPQRGARCVSLSHSQSWYAGATGDGAVGIDLQHYRPFGAAARRQAFSVGERGLGPVQSCAAWAIREAFLKSHGRGLPYRLSDIHIDWRNQQVVSAAGGLTRRRFWLWYSLEWVCALCYSGNVSLTPWVEILPLEVRDDA
ncbi:4'-phosphopantetheinyl transferase superfamily protein [Serratia rubidaea]|uniref:4'-phosphopantetheinyl transferase psf-1 n=1 Tax=Serratia rubidaea TaxID=61652 RepID=A0A3S4XDH5_SERRU|nr:4'-phosphopantetheinyl transferase superfamily protein [Serratia rubidaea]MBH1931596.1 4'-phosphopantetheinyl transferase superfamily protein [Serratia rubidaea]VEI64202.1 4'-phosphopantetheinyl transferase psf-1 [Serratia rubidaea]